MCPSHTTHTQTLPCTGQANPNDSPILLRIEFSRGRSAQVLIMALIIIITPMGHTMGQPQGSVRFPHPAICVRLSVLSITLLNINPRLLGSPCRYDAMCKDCLSEPGQPETFLWGPAAAEQWPERHPLSWYGKTNSESAPLVRALRSGEK
jgi:hypothetical protein